MFRSVEFGSKMLQQDIAQVQRDFYDSLYVHGLLQSNTVKQIKSGQQRLPRSNATRKRKPWELFLDDLSLLCDFKPGGETTTAIAVEQQVYQAIFWVASNSQRDKGIKNYLRGLLKLLQLGSQDSERKDQCVEFVCERAVKRSPRRVQNYLGRLSSAISSLPPHNAGGNERELSPVLVDPATDADQALESNVRSSLNRLLHLHNDHVALCKEAHRLRQTSAVRRFLKAPRRDKYDCWFQIHHYLARLGSWSRASSSVVKLAHRFADVLAKFDVKIVDAPRNPGYGPLQFEADPQIVLNRIFPNYKGTIILSDALSKMQNASQLCARLLQQPQTPHLHAEVKILNHFFSRGLEFAKGVRYVGCSKPSCYCCAHYFHYHAAKARIGRTHHNVWVKWSLPTPLTQINGEIDRDSLRMMRVMADRVRRDVLGLIISNGNPLVAMFDSTTGLTSSARAFSR